MNVKSLVKTSLHNQYDLTQNDETCSFCGGTIQTQKLTFRRELPESDEYDSVDHQVFVYVCDQPDCERHLTEEEQHQVAKVKFNGEVKDLLEDEDRPGPPSDDQ